MHPKSLRSGRLKPVRAYICFMWHIAGETFENVSHAPVHPIIWICEVTCFKAPTGLLCAWLYGCTYVQSRVLSR